MTSENGDLWNDVVQFFSTKLSAKKIILMGSPARSETMKAFFQKCGAKVFSLPIKCETSDAAARIATYENVLEQPTDKIAKCIKKVDPNQEALIYAGSFTKVKTICGRQVIGRRSGEHFRAERKDCQKHIFGFEGMLLESAQNLNEMPNSLVIQGIPQSGLALAASHTYLIPAQSSGERLHQLVAKLKRDCRKFIVRNFDRGVPCTFYGYVSSDCVVDFGPVEALVFWDEATNRIHAKGIVRPLALSTVVEDNVRAKVHKLARILNQKTGYDGAFGVDGMIVNGDYAVHEINPRICAGFALFDNLDPGNPPLSIFDLALREYPESRQIFWPHLAGMSIAFNKLTGFSYQLWNAPTNAISFGSDARKFLCLENQVREAAANGLTPIGAQKVYHETN